MTDEEKKSIEDLKEVIELYNDECLITTEDDFKSIKILLNLIEKQSKEIEELKEKNEYLPNWVSKKYVSKDKIKAKIEEIERRIDYLDKELTEAYIMREKLGTETEIDTNEQYIYNMEQERSIRHTQKRVLQSLLEKE